jgi:hypothetical protein
MGIIYMSKILINDLSNRKQIGKNLRINKMPKVKLLKLTIFSFALMSFFGSAFSTASAQSKIKENESGSHSFACYRNPKTGLPTTFAIRNGDEGRVGVPVIQWKSTYFGEYSPESRCKIVSERMQNLGTTRLSYITNSWLNGQPVICAAADMSSSEKRCINSRLIFTLESNDDANKVLKDFENVMAGNAKGAITRTVPPTVGGKFYVNMARLVRDGKRVTLGDRL